MMQQKVEISMHNNITAHTQKKLLGLSKTTVALRALKTTCIQTISLQLSGFSLFSRYHTVLNSQNKTKLRYL